MKKYVQFLVTLLILGSGHVTAQDNQQCFKTFPFLQKMQKLKTILQPMSHVEVKI